MSSNETHRPFVGPLQREGLVAVPTPEHVVNEALRIESLKDQEVSLLRRTLEESQGIEIDSVKDAVEAFLKTKEHLDSILYVLRSEVTLLRLPEYDAKLDEADKLLLDLRDIRGEVVSILISEAMKNMETDSGVNPATLPTESILEKEAINDIKSMSTDPSLSSVPSPQVLPAGTNEEPAVLPIGEVVANGSGEAISVDHAVTNIGEVATPDTLATNLDPVLETDEDVFSREISKVPPEKRSAFYNLDDQRPRSPEERYTLKLFELFQLGEREALIKPEGGVKKLKQIKDEIRKVLALAGYRPEQVNHLFKDQIDKITDEIVSLNRNYVLKYREKRKWLDDAHDRLLGIVTSMVKDSNPRFARPSATVDEVKSAETTVISDPVVIKTDQDISVLPGDNNNVSASQNPPVLDLNVTDTLTPFANQAPDLSVSSEAIPSAVDTVAPGVTEVTPTIDNQTPGTLEPTAPETIESLVEAFTKEKERYYSLIESVNKSRLLSLKFYWIPSRAVPTIGAVDYVINDSKYEETVKQEKILKNTDILTKLNHLMAEDLALEINKSSSKPVPVPQPITLPTSEAAHLNLVSTDTLMKSEAEKAKEAEVAKAEWRLSVGLASERPVDVLKPEEREILNSKYRSERTKSIEARRKFKEIEADYQFSLNEFYNHKAGQSFFGNLADGTTKLFGGRPKFTPKLEGLEIAYKQARKEYLPVLSEALFTRSGATFGNKIYSETSDSTKQAFGEKFILEPRKELLRLQEDLFLSQHKNSKLKPIMDLMRKHKGKVRALGLLTAAGIGAATGGAALAGLNSVRWGVSTFGGAALAEAVYRQRQSEVDKIKKSIEMLEEDAKRNFSIDNIDSLADSLTKHDYKKETAEIRKKAITTGVAIGFGGLVSAGASMIDIPSGRGVTRAEAEGSEAGADTVNDEAARSAHERRVLEIEQNVRNINEAVAKDNARVSAERSGVSYRVPANEVATEVIQNLDVTPETLLQMRGVKVPHYSLSGELLYHTSVSNIRLQGLNTDALSETALPDAKVIEIYSVLNQRINDLLAARPGFSQDKLEKLLFERLESIYGGEEWWTSAKINEVKIGSMVDNGPGVPATVKEVGTLVADVTPVDSIAPGEAIAVNAHIEADNLPAKDLVLPSTEQPYQFSAKGPIIYTRSGGLSIEQADTGVASVPIINAIYNPAEAVKAQTLGETLTPREINYVPLAQVEDLHLPPNPEKYVAAGNYTESPDFKDYVSSEYGGMDRFNKIVIKEALKVEGETYDIFNTWLNEYQSPYEMSLAKMTIGDLKEAFGGPDLGTEVVGVDSTGLPKQYNTEAIREYSSVNNFNYETVRNWLITLEALKKEFPHQSSTTLQDLFARSIIKTDLLALKTKGISA